MYCYVCEDSIDGIFTAVYDAWASGHGHKNIRLTCKTIDNYELFTEYIEVENDNEKSQKVSKTLCEKFGRDNYETICNAILARGKKPKKALNKADCVYRTILLGFAMKEPRRVLEALGEPYVNYIFQLGRATGREAEHLMGFLRFSELYNGVLHAKIHPENHVISILAAHFTDRLPQENFIILDENRNLAAVHMAGSGFLLTDASELNRELLSRYSDKEVEYQKLWCRFFETIAIKERKNPALQSQNIPKRFWKDTVELKDNIGLKDTIELSPR